jgi:hypothetical protein
MLGQLPGISCRTDEPAVGGITKVVLQPGGSHVRGELTRMAAAADRQATERGVGAASTR